MGNKWSWSRIKYRIKNLLKPKKTTIKKRFFFRKAIKKAVAGLFFRSKKIKIPTIVTKPTVGGDRVIGIKIPTIGAGGISKPINTKNRFYWRNATKKQVADVAEKFIRSKSFQETFQDTHLKNYNGLIEIYKSKTTDAEKEAFLMDPSNNRAMRAFLMSLTELGVKGSEMEARQSKLVDAINIGEQGYDLLNADPDEFINSTIVKVFKSEQRLIVGIYAFLEQLDTYSEDELSDKAAFIDEALETGILYDDILLTLKSGNKEKAEEELSFLVNRFGYATNTDGNVIYENFQNHIDFSDKYSRADKKIAGEFLNTAIASTFN